VSFSLLRDVLVTKIHNGLRPLALAAQAGRFDAGSWKLDAGEVTLGIEVDPSLDLPHETNDLKLGSTLIHRLPLPDGGKADPASGPGIDPGELGSRFGGGICRREKEGEQAVIQNDDAWSAREFAGHLRGPAD